MCSNHKLHLKPTFIILDTCSLCWYLQCNVKWNIYLWDRISVHIIVCFNVLYEFTGQLQCLLIQQIGHTTLTLIHMDGQRGHTRNPTQRYRYGPLHINWTTKIV